MAIKVVKKRDILLRQGDMSSKFFLVRSGLLRSYMIDQKGREHIFMFAPEKWVAVDNKAFNDPSDLFIDALEDSEIEIFDKSMIFDPQISEKDLPVSRIHLARRLAAFQKRILMLMSASAIERYDHFLNTYPDISCRVPQKMIASYLGITPEALSKVKSLRTRVSNK